MTRDDVMRELAAIMDRAAERARRDFGTPAEKIIAETLDELAQLKRRTSAPH